MTYNRCGVCGGFLRTEAITIDGKRACRCTNQLTRAIPGQPGQVATGIMMACATLCMSMADRLTTTPTSMRRVLQ